MDLPPTAKGTTKLSIYKELFLPLSRTYGTRMIFFSILITALYCLLIGALYIGWRRIPEVEKIYSEPEKRFSVIIPYRNEAQNLPGLFFSLSKIKYPEQLFEIILINDESGDNSEQLCISFKEDHSNLSVKLLPNLRKTNSPKKDAINEGIKYSQYEYIITTDADCVVGELWLNHFNNSLVKIGASFIAGPVDYLSSKGLKYFQAFQEMDFMSLQAAGAGGFGLNLPFMCNGANMCYEKSAFLEVKGFSGNENISSGDDVFLLQKFTEYHFPVAFLKSREATVFTKPQPDMHSLISQRIRWAAKTPAYKSFFAKTLGLVILLMNLWILTGGIFVLFDSVDSEVFLLSFFLKFIFDLLLIFQAAKFFRKKYILRNFFWSSILYPFFSVYVAVLSLFKGFEWKGRRFVR